MIPECDPYDGPPAPSKAPLKNLVKKVRKRFGRKIIASDLAGPDHKDLGSVEATIKKVGRSVSNIIVISDLHCGCQFGLCAPKPRLDGGGSYNLSPSQKKLYELWNEHFWNGWVPKVTRGEPYAIVVNGDTTDGRHHGSTTQITQNLSDQANIAEQLLEPLMEKCDGNMYIIRGTSVHVGEAAENEERLAKRLGTIQDAEGNYAHNELWIKMGDCLSHILHHIGTSGSTAYEPTALARELGEMFAEAGRWNLEAPNVIIRSHRHRLSEVTLPTADGYGICVTTPAWQLKTPFVWKIAGGRVSTPQFGGILIRQGDEEFYVRHKVWNAKRSRTVII